jgi:IS5 family transposase
VPSLRRDEPVRAGPRASQLDQLLDDDRLFQAVLAGLLRCSPHAVICGRPSTPVEGVLCMLVVKRLERGGDEETEQFVGDSLIWRQFCRLYLEQAPDDTTLLRWAKVIGRRTLE